MQILAHICHLQILAHICNMKMLAHICILHPILAHKCILHPTCGKQQQHGSRDGPISLKTANKKPLHAVAIVMSPQHIKFRAAIAAVYKIYICIYIHTTVLYIYIYIFIYTYSLLASSSLGGSSSGDSSILFVKLLFILEPDFDPRVVHNLFTLIHVSRILCDCEKTPVCAP